MFKFLIVLFQASIRPMADRYIQWHWDRLEKFYQDHDPQTTTMLDKHFKNTLPELSGFSAKEAKPHAPKLYRQLKRFKKKLGLK